MSYGNGRAAKRRRWLHARLIELAVADELPTTVSSLYYEGAQLGCWPSDDEAKAAGRKRLPRQDVSDDVRWLIDRDLVPPDSVVDLSRRVIDLMAPDDLRSGAYAYAEAQPVSPWGDCPRPLLIVESRSVAAAMQRVADRYCIAVVPLGGQGGRSFLRHDVAPLIEPETPIGYAGDWNPPALHIEGNVIRQIERLVRSWSGSWTTLAVLDADTVGRTPKRKLDRRYRPPRVYESIEAEALGMTELRRRSTEWLDVFLPPGFSWEAHEARTRTQRDDVLARLRADGGT